MRDYVTWCSNSDMSQFILMHSRDFPTVLTTQMLWTVSSISKHHFTILKWKKIHL